MTTGENGGSEPHLFDTDRGRYMVKARNNPQEPRDKERPRVLVNDLIGGLCLDWLGVEHPAPAVVDIPQAVIDDSPGARYRDGTPIAAGLAFGSEFWQSSPRENFAPDLIANPSSVAGTQALDSWLGQYDAPDSRQYRALPSKADPKKYDHFPVDQGHCLGPPDWTAAGLDGKHDSVAVPASCIPLRREDVQPFIDRLSTFDAATAAHIVAQVPDEWLTDDERVALKRYLTARAKVAASALAQKYKP